METDRILEKGWMRETTGIIQPFFEDRFGNILTADNAA